MYYTSIYKVTIPNSLNDKYSKGDMQQYRFYISWQWLQAWLAEIGFYGAVWYHTTIETSLSFCTS